MKAQKLAIVEAPTKAKKPPPTVNPGSSGTTAISALTFEENIHLHHERREPEESTVASAIADSCTSRLSVRCCLLQDTPSPDHSGQTTLVALGNDSGTKQIKGQIVKKTRHTSKQKRRHSASLVTQLKLDKAAMKLATVAIEQNKKLPRKHPERSTILKIVEETNCRMNSNKSAKTAADYVRKALIDMSPLL